MPRLKKSLLLLPLLWASLCRADPSTRADAEKHYLAGDFEKARQAYHAELVAAGNPGVLPPVFYFNYGTALARAGLSGEAYVALLRAASLLPFDSDTRMNLLLVQQKVPAAVLSVQPANWFDWWPRSLRVHPWQLWMSASLIISALALLLARQKDRAYLAMAGALSVFLFLAAGLAWFQQRDPVYGVVTLAKVKSGPASTFSDILTLEPGSLVNRELEKDGWLKIRFQRGEAGETVGWVEPGNLLEVR